MAPVTRAALSPARIQDNVGRVLSTTPRGRKMPHCTICQKPRKGHPRQGCPNQMPKVGLWDAPTSNLAGNLSSLHLESGVGSVPSPASPTTSHLKRLLMIRQDFPSLDLADALDSLHIDSDVADMVTSATSSASTAIKDPFMKARIRRRRGHLMPGTLLQPTNSSLVSETSNPPSSPPKETFEELLVPLQEPLSLTPTGESTAAVHLSCPLVRSASMNARIEFLEDLDHVAARMPVSVYAIPTGEVEHLQPSAKKLGFSTAVVIPEHSRRGNEALLVIGTEDAAVGDVHDRLTKDVDVMTRRNGEYGLAQVVGGAVVGAMAVFAGLSL
ncbi:unnamed protein product [Peniophora sp. CBMAI 1063]|nr:unnamed protein product [Peniophora sp. CBMAI 1063]